MAKRAAKRAITVADVVGWGRQMGDAYGVQISYRLVPASDPRTPAVEAFIVAYVDGVKESHPYSGCRALLPWPTVACRTLEGAFLRVTHSLDHMLYHKQQELRARTDELPF